MIYFPLPCLQAGCGTHLVSYAAGARDFFRRRRRRRGGRRRRRRRKKEERKKEEEKEEEKTKEEEEEEKKKKKKKKEEEEEEKKKKKKKLFFNPYGVAYLTELSHCTQKGLITLLSNRNKNLKHEYNCNSIQVHQTFNRHTI